MIVALWCCAYCNTRQTIIASSPEKARELCCEIAARHWEATSHDRGCFFHTVTLWERVPA